MNTKDLFRPGTYTSISANFAEGIPFAALAKACSPVLTYHASFKDIPDNVSKADNVTPNQMYKQLEEMKRHFKFVTIDEFGEAKSVRGLASVTFDDGYKTVIEQALPVFEALQVPFTIFLTFSSLAHKVFWRHKVIHIVRNGLVEACERSFRRVRKIRGESFYEYLKNPANNSRVVEQEIDEFLAASNIPLEKQSWLIDDESYLIDHPQIWYGNHSYSHYVLSSLSFEEQVEEIDRGRAFLARHPALKVSRVFAPPFGQARHVNRDTLTILRNLGYAGMALNRDRLATRPVTDQNISIIERFSPAESSLKLQCKKNWLKGLIRRRDVPIDRPRNAASGRRIVHLVNILGTGGLERMVSSLALQLQTDGDSVHIVSLRGTGAMLIGEDRFAQEGVALKHFGKEDGFSAGTLLDLAAYLRRYDIQIVHTHNPLVHHYGVAAARLAGTPVVLNTVHGISTLTMADWARALYRVSCNASSHIVHVSEAVRNAFSKDIVDLGGRQSVIPNGIDFNGLLDLRPREPDGAFVFGTIGRLVPVKDHQLLIRAFALVHQQHPNTRLEILGDGELELELRRLSLELGLSAQIVFHGWSADIKAFLGRIDMFVLSSLSEGLPLTLLESMAAGIPAIATRVGGIPEVLDLSQSGWLCPSGDSVLLAETMAMALSAGDLNEKGIRAREYVIAHHSIDKLAADYSRLFDHLLGALPSAAVNLQAGHQWT